ncbi:MAG TPA: hypothetical protein VGG74_30360 [Kofleriaceae bacterium]|jgi:hypothetical protein
MRFCPFCSAENNDDLAVCQACGRRLPPLPPRARARNAPPTGIQLPPRRTSATVPPSGPQHAPAPPRTAPQPTQPPPTTHDASSVRTQTLPSVPVPQRSTKPSQPPPIPPAPAPAPTVDTLELTGDLVDTRQRDSAPALPPPPTPPPDHADDQRRQLANALSPSPAAQRREASNEPRIIADRRRTGDSKPPAFSPSSKLPPALTPIAKPAAALPPVSSSDFGGDTFLTDNDLLKAPPEPAYPVGQRSREPDDPPPTRIHRGEALVDRPFSPPEVLAVPEIPEPGLVKSARYAYVFARARWQRRGAIRQLGVEIKQDTEALDGVLGGLGRAARGARVEGRVFAAENTAISMAEERISHLQKESGEVDGRKAEENSKFVDVERERNAKLTEADRGVEEAQRELATLEAQRRAARDKRKELERRQKAYLKAADDSERQSSAAPMGDNRQEMRRVAEGHRREAAALEPERQEIDRKLASIERPIGEITARLDAGKAELDAAKRSLGDAREGHTHRLAELDAEQKRKLREIALAEGEIQRRLVTLGTLVNLNRIEDPSFGELYERIDRLRGAITARTTEIERLAAEREAYDRGTLVRGIATIGGAMVGLIALIVILAAIL